MPKMDDFETATRKLRCNRKIKKERKINNYVMVIFPSIYPIIKTKQEMLNMYFNKNIAKIDEVKRWFILNPLRNKIVCITE